MTDQIEIVARELRHGERLFAAGDKIVLKTYLDNRSMNERHVKILRDQKQVVPLTRENYAMAVARHPHGHIGRGFTAEFLIENGIIDAPVVAAKAPAAEKKPAKPKRAHRETQEIAERIPRTAETVEYKGRFLTPVPRSTSPLPPLWYATASDGARLRDTGFRTVDSAKAFVDKLEAADLANGPAADTSAGEAEQPAAEDQAHDSDVSAGPV